MPGEKEGEVIELFEDDGCIYDDEIYVRGHVDPDFATEAYVGWWHDVIAIEGEEPLELGPWKHAYARWAHDASYDAPGMVLMGYSEPGRGRFKVTVCEPQWRIDERNEHKSREDEATAAFLERYPGTTILQVNAWHKDDPVRVWFDVPGTQGGAVHWRSDDPEHVSIRTVDVPHWEAYKTFRGLA